MTEVLAIINGDLLASTSSRRYPDFVGLPLAACLPSAEARRKRRPYHPAPLDHWYQAEAAR